MHCHHQFWGSPVANRNRVNSLTCFGIISWMLASTLGHMAHIPSDTVGHSSCILSVDGRSHKCAIGGAGLKTLRHSAPSSSIFSHGTTPLTQHGGRCCTRTPHFKTSAHHVTVPATVIDISPCLHTHTLMARSRKASAMLILRFLTHLWAHPDRGAICRTATRSQTDRESRERLEL